VFVFVCCVTFSGFKSLLLSYSRGLICAFRSLSVRRLSVTLVQPLHGTICRLISAQWAPVQRVFSHGGPFTRRHRVTISNQLLCDHSCLCTGLGTGPADPALPSDQ